MADLDNFFAKKDRKKTKGQKFATSTDNMATSQEELLKKQEKQKKERTLLQNIHSSENDKSSGRKVGDKPFCYPLQYRLELSSVVHYNRVFYDIVLCYLLYVGNRQIMFCTSHYELSYDYQCTVYYIICTYSFILYSLCNLGDLNNLRAKE